MNRYGRLRITIAGNEVRADFGPTADDNDAGWLLEDRDSMRHYAWAVLRLMRSGLSSDELRDLT